MRQTKLFHKINENKIIRKNIKDNVVDKLLADD